MNVEEIKILLSIYGEITEIWMRKNRGFVTFKKGCDATKALLNRKNFSEHLILLPADTWHQPDFIKVKFIDTKVDGDSQLLRILDDDCLLQIISFLDFFDVIMLKDVCTKFNELAEIHFKTMKVLNFMDLKPKQKLTLLETKIAMKFAGPNVHTVTINSDKFYSNRILNFVPKYFTNLKNLHVTGFKLDSIEFWQHMKKILLKLEMFNLSDNSSINENFLKCFKSTQKCLQHLNISNSTISGNALKGLSVMQSLNVSGCVNVTGSDLIEFIKNNPCLKSLDVTTCPRINGKAINEILALLQQLESVALDNYYIDDETSRIVIPNINSLIDLKHLTVQNINYPPCDQLLATINPENRIEILEISYGKLTLTTICAINTMKRLRKLIMNFKNSVPENFVEFLRNQLELEEVHIAGCCYISPGNILRLLQLPRINFLDISRCYGFDNEFLIQVFETLRQVQREKLLTIKVGLTEIDLVTLDDPFMKGHEKYLSIDWKTTKDAVHDYDIDEDNNKIDNINHQDCFNVDGNIFGHYL